MLYYNLMMYMHNCAFSFESIGLGNINISYLKEILQKKVFSNAKDQKSDYLGYYRSIPISGIKKKEVWITQNQVILIRFPS